MVLAVAGWKTQGDAGLVLFMEDELATMGWFLGIPVATWVVIQLSPELKDETICFM